VNGSPPPLVSLRIATEQDVVIARQRARDVAALAGLDRPDQIRVATAVSDVARLALGRAGGDARVEVSLGDWRGAPALLVAFACSPAAARLERLLEEGRATAPGDAPSVLRLVDGAAPAGGGAAGAGMVLAKVLPAGAAGRRDLGRERLAADLAKMASPGLYEELRLQGQELLQALQELRGREEELTRLNRELVDANRGTRALYAELQERAEQLRDASESKTRFLRTIGHELRTPVNAIAALGRMLLDPAGGPLGGEHRRQVSLIVGAANDLMALVSDLLDLARAEANRLEVCPGDFGLEEVFATLRGLLRPLVSSDAVALVFEEPRGVPRLHSDELRLSQVLRNLVVNALKFTERGEVRVRAAFDPGAGLLAVSVTDTGIGIAPEDRERIFEEFAQVPGPVQQRSRGTGLGLALSRRLARLLGGHLTLLESEVGRGSTFALVIPIRAPEKTVAAAAGSPAPQPPAGAAEARP
jgi:signal transduction histidine kinase